MMDLLAEFPHHQQLILALLAEFPHPPSMLDSSVEFPLLPPMMALLAEFPHHQQLILDSSVEFPLPPWMMALLAEFPHLPLMMASLVECPLPLKKDNLLSVKKKPLDYSSFLESGGRIDQIGLLRRCSEF